MNLDVSQEQNLANRRIRLFAPLGAAVLTTGFLTTLEIVTLFLPDGPELAGSQDLIAFGAQAFLLILCAVIATIPIAAWLTRPPGEVRDPSWSRPLVHGLLAAGATLIVLLWSMTRPNASRLAIAGLMALGVATVTAIVSRRLSLHRRTGRNAGRLARALAVATMATATIVCFAASRCLWTNDYTTLHMLLAAGSVLAGSMAITLVMRARREIRPRLLSSTLCALVSVSVLLVIPFPEASRIYVRTRTGIAGYVLAATDQVAGWFRTDELDSDPHRQAAVVDTPPSSSESPAASDVPVVWILVDTLRADRVGPAPDRRSLTPSIDAFARESVVCEQAWSQAVASAPSYCSIFTSRYPSIRRRAWWAGSKKREKGTFLLSPTHECFADDGPWLEKTVGIALDIGQFRTAIPDPEDHDGCIPGHAREFLQSRVGSKPPFLWLALTGIHSDQSWSNRALYTPAWMMSKAYTERYERAVQRADQIVGSILSVLREAGLYERSMIALFADHGEGLGEHGDLFHASTLAVGTTHVPMMIRFPGGTKQGTIRSPVELIDLLPTTAEVAGIRPPRTASFAGRSLLQLADGQPGLPRQCFSLSVFMRREVVQLLSWDSDGTCWQGIYDRTHDLLELHDLSKHGERLNLVDVCPDRATAMRRDIRTFLSGVSGPRFLPVPY